mmetsp:Transcript_44298/g.108112  ORF Transcript_44298/g.108112 Transcript_44298/m.108112 type:complete len:258 (-) Transcript_44298:52-825(-)
MSQPSGVGLKGRQEPPSFTRECIRTSLSGYTAGGVGGWREITRSCISSSLPSDLAGASEGGLSDASALEAASSVTVASVSCDSAMGSTALRAHVAAVLVVEVVALLHSDPWEQAWVDRELHAELLPPALLPATAFPVLGLGRSWRSEVFGLMSESGLRLCPTTCPFTAPSGCGCWTTGSMASLSSSPPCALPLPVMPPLSSKASAAVRSSPQTALPASPAAVLRISRSAPTQWSHRCLTAPIHTHPAFLCPPSAAAR